MISQAPTLTACGRSRGGLLPIVAIDICGPTFAERTIGVVVDLTILNTPCRHHPLFCTDLGFCWGKWISVLRDVLINDFVSFEA